MGAGEFRHRITVQRDEGTTDGDFGAHVESWTNLFVDVPAAIDTGGSMKFYVAKQVEQKMSHMITVRHIAPLDITDKLRIIWGARTFNLLGPPLDVDGKRRKYEFRCVEHVT